MDKGANPQPATLFNPQKINMREIKQIIII